MAYKDIRHFIKVLHQKDQLKVIRASVSPELEVAEMGNRVLQNKGPALLFQNIQGAEYPLLVNTFGGYRRMALAFEVRKFSDIGKDLENITGIGRALPFLERHGALPHLSRLFTVLPVRIFGKAPCQQVVEKPDLSKLPILKNWPGDAGKVITMPLVFIRDPDSGEQDFRMGRMQVYDNRTTSIHWDFSGKAGEVYEKYRRYGGRMPVSVVVGCDPAVLYAGYAPLPHQSDRMLLAGQIRRFPVMMAKSITNQILIPANSEFVLEGYIDPRETRKEGPLGGESGYYARQAERPVFHLTKITRKQSPIFMASLSGELPGEHSFIEKASERMLLPVIRRTAPEVVDINVPMEGGLRHCLIVSIDKKFHGHARKVINALWGMEQLMHTKVIVVVDKSINPHHLSKVAWRVLHNVDPRQDILSSDGPGSMQHPCKDGRLGIDGTGNFAREGAGEGLQTGVEMSDAIRRLVTRRWAEYGF